MSIGRTFSREDGATAILLMIVLTVLLGFAAIAVDGAAAWALKRQDQSAADTGAVAGAIFTANRTKAQAMLDAETEIIRITFATVSPDMTLPEWTTEWANCVDSNKPARFVENLNSPCISFASNLSEVRVQTPIIPSPASFAGIFGVTQLDTSAAAEVTTNLVSRGGVLPFGLPGNAAGNTEICLKTGANPKNIAPCDGPDTGNFSFLDFTEFGNDNKPFETTTSCQGGGTARLVRNIAHGVDHPLSTTNIFPMTPPNTDRDACFDGNFNARPYQVATQPGNVAQALDDGLADGIGGVNGRLADGTNPLNVRGNMLDNTPLSALLDDAGKIACGPSASHDDMVTCLTDYTGGVIFQDAIGFAPRFGWVPLFHEATLGSGATTLTMKTFRPVYIQTTFWNCNAMGCDLEWDPGEPNPDIIGPNNVRIEASTAIIIPLSALPEGVRHSQAGTDGQIQYLISK